MQEIFAENKSEMLQGAIIWTPMLATDNVDAANQREIKFSDPRVKQFWDPDQVLGQWLSRTLSLKAPVAWDVYLIYAPNHPWDTELPPIPDFWMHQLNEDPALYFNPERFRRYVQTLLEEL